MVMMAMMMMGINKGWWHYEYGGSINQSIVMTPFFLHHQVSPLSTFPICHNMYDYTLLIRIMAQKVIYNITIGPEKRLIETLLAKMVRNGQLFSTKPSLPSIKLRETGPVNIPLTHNLVMTYIKIRCRVWMDHLTMIWLHETTKMCKICQNWSKFSPCGFSMDKILFKINFPSTPNQSSQFTPSVDDLAYPLYMVKSLELVVLEIVLVQGTHVAKNPSVFHPPRHPINHWYR